MKNLLKILVFWATVTVSYGQTISSNAIMEQDTLDTNAPCTYCTTWRFARADSTLYRWNVDTEIWERYTGVRIFNISSAADTSTITSPQTGDIAYVDSTLMYLHDEFWRKFSGSSGGGGSDGVATSGSFSDITEQLTINVDAPGSNFDIDLSTVATDDELDQVNDRLLDSIGQHRIELDSMATMEYVRTYHADGSTFYLANDTLADPVVFDLDTIREINVVSFQSVPVGVSAIVNIPVAPIGRYMFHLKNTKSQNVDFPATFNLANGELADDGGEHFLFKDQMWDCYSSGESYYCNTPSSSNIFAPFVFRVDTRNTGAGSTDSLTFRLPFYLGAINDFVINWGDATEETHTGDTLSHIYATAGVYNITIQGQIGRWAFNNSGDQLKITNILDWGDFPLTSEAFYGCSNLNVDATDSPITRTSLRSAFRDCTSLTSLDVSTWNTSSVTNLGYFVRGCTSLTSLDVSEWNTSNVVDYSYFAQNCTSLTTLDVSNWNTASSVNFAGFVQNCPVLTVLDVSGWVTENVENFSYFIRDCELIDTLDVSGWVTENVTTFTFFAYLCDSLKVLDVSNWNTASVNNFSYFVLGCKSLTTLDVSSWNTSSVTNFAGFAQDCSSLTSLDVSNWNTSGVNNFSYFIRGANSLTSLDVSSWTTSSVTNFSFFAFSCTSLTTLDVSSWNTASVTNFSYFVLGCSSLTGFNPSNWNVTAMTTATSFATGVTISTTNYDATLVNWEAQSVNNSINVHFGNSQYTNSSAAATARGALVADHTWTITDGGGI